MAQRKWTKVFTMPYEMHTLSSEDQVFDRMHQIFLMDVPQLKQRICLLMKPDICLRPRRQIFLFAKKC